MQGNYGSRFLNQWKTGQQAADGSDVGIANAMATWSRKLAGFADIPEALKSVLESLPADPPSLPEFVNLCRSAGTRLVENRTRIEHKLTEEEKKRADEAARRVVDVIKNIPGRDHNAWANKLKARHESGDVLSLIQVTAYQEALSGNYNDPGQEDAA